jgi:hypothetical protein
MVEVVRHGTCYRINRAGPPSRDGVPLEACPAKSVAPRLKPPVHGAILAIGSGQTYIADMVKIAISQEAFDAIAGAMPVESVGFAQTNERGERLIWLPRGVVAKLRAMRGRGESYSNVILRLRQRLRRLGEAHADLRLVNLEGAAAEQRMIPSFLGEMEQAHFETQEHPPL